MRAVSYGRVSTDEQVKEGHSLEGQNDRNISFIHSQGWDYVDSYIDDGYSAKDLNRPNVKQLLKDAEKKKFDVVVVYRLDRIVRTVTDLHFILDHFDKHGILFKSVTEIYDTTTAMGRFFITLVAAIAQWERENLAERVRMGMEENFLKGGWNGGEPPFGYKIVDGKLEIEESERAVTSFIFKELVHRGGSNIAKQLNREGKHMRNGTLWSDYAIGSMVQNPTYSGQRRWGYRTVKGKKTGKELIGEGSHPAYITPEQQEKLLSIRKQRYVGREKTTTDYPFTGVLKCHRCGHTLNGTVKKNKNSSQRFYRCYGRFGYGLCDLPVISEDTLEELLMEQLDVVSDPAWMKEIAVAKEPSNDQTDFKKELEEITRRKKKWQFAFANDAITLDDLKARMAEENVKEEELRNTLESELDEPIEAHMSPRDIVKFAKDLRKNWEYFEMSHKKLAIHSLFKEIVVDATGPAIGGPGRRTPCEITSITTK